MGKIKQRALKPRRIGQYPIDDLGFPLHPEEVDARFSEPVMDFRGGQNNHHLNFCARTFGQYAISQTFRDLNSFQFQMPLWRHTLLHQIYGPMDLPPFKNMIRRIEEEMETPDALNIFSKEDNQYHRQDITREAWCNLMREYGEVALGGIIIDLKSADS